VISRDLGEDIARNNRLWQTMPLDGRIATRQRWASDGWHVCPHDHCPPWDCRKTNP
jgi:hypothetical protein